MIDKKRRDFLTTIGLTTATVPLSTLLTSLPSHADKLPLVDPDSPAAKALEFRTEAKLFSRRCGSCTLFNGEPGAETGPCPLFEGNVVSTKSWCAAYTPKA